MHIKKWAHTGSFVEFTVLVVVHGATTKEFDPSRVFTIHKRFAQFAALHKSLVALGLALPNMPTVDLWTNVMIKLTPDACLDERRQQLQKILDRIAQSPEVQRTDAYQEFIATNVAPTNYTSLRDVHHVPHMGSPDLVRLIRMESD
ncbi:Aste57867_516 [Aphanomyces stellatus]|uniref:Aste57867_516 protein n=1 Tax=Aphanomyces stellatus TaxID=120398 RepID=A0A485K304_9STRA|nr:hypothetical protein As57867_000515 [Aphanomyces stellatus]VFT77741.1 Aste57867_516 [Aphanomyces stellatus]